MRLKPENAEVGMYVRKFAGNWLSHPFWRAHFVIESDEDLQKVRSAGTDFFIDVSKSVSTKPVERKTSYRELAKPRRANASVQRPADITTAPVRSRRVSRSTIAAPTFGKADKARAATLAQRSSQVVKSLFDDCRLGRSVSTDEILSVVQDIGEILEKNSSALISVTRLKSKDEYTYTHSVAVCALMINLGRETGATGDALESLGVAGLLHDIGKVRIDQAILQKDAPLTDLEKLEVDKHPEFGHRLLSAEPRIPAVALDVCLHHHERLDGSGYPFGLSGDDISRAVRMAAICDVYDAATSDRPYKRGKTPIETITEMYERPEHFDQEMLFRFMRSIGVFPVGKLIRLRSNRLGVALPCAQGDTRPVIRAFYSTIDTCFIDCVDVILSANLADDQAIGSEDPEVWFSENWYDVYTGIVGSVSRPS